MSNKSSIFLFLSTTLIYRHVNDTHVRQKSLTGLIKESKKWLSAQCVTLSISFFNVLDGSRATTVFPVTCTTSEMCNV